MTLNSRRPINNHWILAAAGITPRSSGTYSVAAIQAALAATYCAAVAVSCNGTIFNET
jgi:hypothetical protein